MKKELGFIGLGRMGLNMATLLTEKGFHVIGLDQSGAAKDAALSAGITYADDVHFLVEKLETPRVIWLMVPSKAVDSVLLSLTPLLSPGDTIIDGGNSFYQDTIRRSSELKEGGITFIDCGTSGGVSGARTGASLMVGASEQHFNANEHIFLALAAPLGYARVGGVGAGHFVKMVHNGIEYGMMGAIAEGMNILHEHTEELGISIERTLLPYEHQSIITSRLLSWLAEAYKSGQIDSIRGEVPLGETEPEMEHILTLGDTKILSAALEQRKESRVQETYIGKLIAAMRNQFGGHNIFTK